MATDRPCACGHVHRQHEIRGGGLFGCYIAGCLCTDFDPAPERVDVLAHKGHRIGWWNGARFLPASPGRAYQLRTTKFVESRAMLRGLMIEADWTLGRSPRVSRRS